MSKKVFYGHNQYVLLLTPLECLSSHEIFKKKWKDFAKSLYFRHKMSEMSHFEQNINFP